MQSDLEIEGLVEWLESSTEPGDSTSFVATVGGAEYDVELIVDDEEPDQIAIILSLPNLVLLSDHAAESLFCDIRKVWAGRVNFRLDQRNRKVEAVYHYSHCDAEEGIFYALRMCQPLSKLFDMIFDTEMWSFRDIVFTLVPKPERDQFN